MKRDKRWLLFVTAIIGIIGCADAVKATSLFGRLPNANKTTTTSSTTTTIASVTAEAVKKDETDGAAANKDAEEPVEEEVTKPPLTGIPQIDYVWDPNLPRELNGFNLSTYPFLNSVPDNNDIDFKCDGLHDGFYASIKYSCQLYHHCVYGVRHDFLCANFTAFDQKSFICHFVSEVNCKASAKYWFRNDALYKATTTTSTTTTTVAPPPTTSQAPERPPLRRPVSARRPLRRRRPQHEYYYDDDEDYLEEDYMEERINRRRKPGRQRNRRPEYDDYDNPRAYKDTEEDPYPARPMHRDRSRTRDENLDDYDYDRRSYDRPRSRTRPAVDSRRYMDEDRRSFADDEEERRPAASDNKRKPLERRPIPRRPAISEDRRSNSEDRRSSFDEPRRRRPISDARPFYDEDEEIDPPPKKSNAPLRDDSDFDEPRPAAKRPITAQEPKTGVIPKVRSSSPVASIFSRPRAPPKISRPVPTSEKKKYEYQPQPIKSQAPTTETPAPAADDDQFYDDDYDYESEAPKSTAQTKVEKPEVKKFPPISSLRDSRPPVTAPREGQLLDSKPHPIENEDQDDRVTSIKPQRSTVPAPVVAPVREVKPEFVDTRSRGSPVKEEPKKPIVELEPEELEEEGEFVEYSDEEIDPKLESVPQKQAEEERVPVVEEERRNDYRSPVQPASSVESSRSHNTNDARSNVDTLRSYKSHTQRLTSPPPTPSSVPFESEDARFYSKSGTKIETNDRDVYNLYNKEPLHSVPQQPSGFKPISHERDDVDPYKLNRPYVRIMKRPFLPSRGGSPYLPRGLKPVGAGISSTEYSTGTSSITAGTEPTSVSGIHLLGLHNSEPISRINFNSNFPSAPAQSAPIGPRTTQSPQIEAPRRHPLDDIYNSDYDVTINDALNPTLKPITQSHESSVAFELSKYNSRHNPYARADVSHSPSQFRSTAVRAPLHTQTRQAAPLRSRAPQQYYDEYEY